MSETKTSNQEPAPAAKPNSAQPKKRRSDTPIYKFYDLKGNQATRLRKECPRCGHGVFLAEHRDRLTCGKCGYTSYKRVQR